jgi:hypothetical protein
MIASKCLNNVTQFIYLGITATNENTSDAEYESRLNSENACYHSVQNISPSYFLFNNLQIKVYKSGHNWSLILREESKCSGT